MADYKIGQTEISDLENSISNYRKAPAERDAVGVKRKTATKSIAQVVSGIKDSYQILDGSVYSMLEDDTFENTYATFAC